MDRIIIWGAGYVGKQACEWCEGKHEVLAFADNDESKWGGRYLGHLILSPGEVLLNEYPILIATIHEKEIIQQLFKLNISHERIRVFHQNISVQNMDEYLYNIQNQELEQKYRNNIKEISIGKLLWDFAGNEMEMDSLTCITGSSGILDYALLKSLILKFKLKTYLEIGTYIGESMHIISDVTQHCYSITVPPEHPMSMKFWCQGNQMFDYSNRMINKKNMTQYLADSRKFDFRTIKGKIDLYYIDADHSYEGVRNDTKKVFENKYEDSFVVWHDFKRPANQLRLAVIKAVEDSLNEDEFKRVYMFDNNLCGIYVPECYKEIFDALCIFNKNELYTYNMKIRFQKIS